MKVEERVLNVQSNIVGERVAMGIDDAAVQHIMSVLTDLYSDQELACIREYSTNAFDAHVEAGVKRPIEVQTPTPLSPYFKVRDFGTGLDLEDIRNIYSRYGASTKRESNEVVGMLGLGCKSALTYTDQFTLTGIKNGIMTHVSISRDANGAGSMTVLSSEATDLEQGVEIIVPAKSGNAFEAKALSFFRYWDKGTVLLNGKAPERVDGLWVTDDLLLCENGDRQAKIVMGNVAYPFPRESTYQSNFRQNLVAFVPIGAVNFTPSREALMMTPKTQACIAELGKRLMKELAASVQREVEESETPWEAARRGHEALILTGLQHTNTKLTFKDVEIPKTLKGIKKSQGHSVYDEGDVLTGTWVTRYRGKNYEWRAEIGTVAAVKSHVFYGFTYKTVTTRMREKLDLWAEKQGYTPDNASMFICVDKIPPDFRAWLDPKQMHSWADVEGMEIPKDPNAPAKPKVAGTYEVYQGGVGYPVPVPADTIDTSLPLYWQGRWESYIGQVKALHPDGKFTLVCLPENRVEKFKRLFPTAVSCKQMAKIAADKWLVGLTDEDKLALNMRVTRVGDNLRMLGLDPSRIDDPQLAQEIREVTNVAKDKLYQEYNTHYSLLPAGTVLKEWKSKAAQKYPLVMELGRYFYADKIKKEHAILYINAVYAAEKGASS